MCSNDKNNLTVLLFYVATLTTIAICIIVGIALYLLLSNVVDFMSMLGLEGYL